MKTWEIVLLIILAVAIVLFTVLYFVGKHLEKKQAEQQNALASAAQTMNMFIIDKKRVRMKDAGLPKMVIDQTPKYLRRAKLPVLKVKVGPRVMTVICDEKIYPQILPKQEIKATVSGIYVTAAKRIRGPVYEPKQKKKGLKKFFSKKDK
ncbi:MAG: hypothetical protein ACI4DS_04680 [Eubacterium sp.]